MNELLPFIYILVLTLLGWVLSLLRWKNERKWVTATVAVIIVPLMFLLPALTNRDGNFSDLQVALGITTLLWGAIAVAIGWGGSIFLRSWRGRKG